MDTLNKARQIGYDGILVAGKWIGAVLGVVAGGLIGAGFGWFPALVAAYFGWTSGGAIGGGIAGVVAFRGVDREEAGHAAGGIAFGLGSAAGAALGAMVLAGVSFPNAIMVTPGHWPGAFGGYAIGGAALGAIVARIFGGEWSLPFAMATLPTVMAAGGAGLAGLIGTRTPTILAVIIGVILIWGAGGLGKGMLSIDPLESRYDDDRPCGY